MADYEGLSNNIIKRAELDNINYRFSKIGNGWKAYDRKYGICMGDFVPVNGDNYLFHPRLGALEELKQAKEEAIRKREKAQKNKNFKLEKERKFRRLTALGLAVVLSGSSFAAGSIVTNMKNNRAESTIEPQRPELSGIQKGYLGQDADITLKYIDYSLGKVHATSTSSPYEMVRERYENIYEYYAMPAYSAYYDYVDYRDMGMSQENVDIALQHYNELAKEYEATVVEFYGDSYQFSSTPLSNAIVKDGEVYIADSFRNYPDGELPDSAIIEDGNFYVPYEYSVLIDGKSNVKGK